MISRDWPAPAKLNLFLHIVGRRADGYHELQTVFQLLDFGDVLDFEVTRGGDVRRVSGPPDLPAEADLVVRAARLLQQRSGSDRGVDIHLHKNIPLQGGLGGGSSDAATVLVALNCLWRLELSVDALAELGRELGADVPVFVRGRSAWAEGIGDRLTPLDLPERWFAVVRPGVSVSTAAVFQAPELTRNSTIITIADFLAAVPGHKTVVLDVVPTAENLAAEAFRILDPAYHDTYGNHLRLERVRLYETPNCWADALRD